MPKLVHAAAMRLALRTRLLHRRAHNTEETRQNCLSLMRATAQPVSVITIVAPAHSKTSISEQPSNPTYHGATLSSFTSISMYPHPLVSFSLRTPSRMADLLRSSCPTNHTDSHPHMVINLLSESQAHLALQFSRPRDNPFASKSYFLSDEGIPILHGCLGALSCSLVKSFPLHDASFTSDRVTDGAGSELFVARVLRVEKGSPHNGSQEDTGDGAGFETDLLPLVYHRQKYTTVDISRTTLSVDIPASDSNRRIP